MQFRQFLKHCALFAVIVALNACAATYVKTPVSVNPLKKVAEMAAKKSDSYAVHWVDENNLELRDSWPVHSVLAIGYSAFHANLHYGGQNLEAQFYLQSNGLITLFIPTYISAQEEGRYGRIIKPYLQSQVAEILDWAGVPNADRRGGSTFETFPRPTSSPAAAP